MKKGHAGFWVSVSVLLIAAVYSFVLFLVKPVFDISSRVLYGATMIAFFLFGMQAIAMSRSKATIVSDSALGIPTAIYFVVQVIGGGIICMSFKNIPLMPVVICEIILLAAYLVVVFLMFAAQSRNAQKAVRKMRLLEDDVLEMMNETTNSEVKKALKNLAEVIHFSDVVSLPGLIDIDHQIARNISILQDELNDESSNLLDRIETLCKLLKERDRIAAILKR